MNGLDVTKHPRFVFFSGVVATQKAPKSLAPQIDLHRMAFTKSLGLKLITGPRFEMCGDDAKIDSPPSLALAATIIDRRLVMNTKVAHPRLSAFAQHVFDRFHQKAGDRGFLFLHMLG